MASINSTTWSNYAILSYKISLSAFLLETTRAHWQAEADRIAVLEQMVALFTERGAPKNDSETFRLEPVGYDVINWWLG